MRGQHTVAVSAWALNTLSSVSLVIANKHLMHTYGFTFATCLTALHFVATAAVGALRGRAETGAPGKAAPDATIAEAPACPASSSSTNSSANIQHTQFNEDRHLLHGDSDHSEVSVVPGVQPMAHVGAAQYALMLLLLISGRTWELLVFGAIADVSIAGMNFSLMLNSIGFYQISKLSVLPAVCFLESVFFKKCFSAPALLSVAMVTLGVGVCIVTDVTLNLPGCAVALVAVVSTALQQVLIGALQRRHKMTSFELLSHTAPIQAGILLLLGPVCDRAISGNYIFRYSFSAPSLAGIGLTCLLAVLCNLSQYLCLGKFSATSFQVLGNLKTLLVLLFGWLLFDTQLTVINVLGMLTAMVGMMLYSWIVQREKAKLAETKKLT